MARKPVDHALNDFLDQMTQLPGGGSCLREKVRVYLPTCDGRCTNKAETARAHLTKLFGGSTTWRGTGSWYDDHGRLFDEPIIVVESAHKPLCSRETKTFVGIIQRYAREAGQDSISIENGMSDFYIGKGTEFKPSLVRYQKGKRRQGT